MKQVIVLNVNEIDYEVMVNPQDLLINVLRRNLGFTGTKKGCGQGDCGTCTVLIDGKRVLACITLAMACQGKKIQTIEGLDDNGKLDPIQQAFLDKGAVQCGFCTPGMVMAAKALLDENPDPTMNEIKRGLSGNLCRCTGYIKIAEAVETAAEARKSAGKGKE
ncbi:MAG: (2Fe-2S)-binding protein [Proteobacteria bacterium]|nr:(2Fe-2S)-binding protein [Pseudomonadota bacterium]